VPPTGAEALAALAAMEAATRDELYQLFGDVQSLLQLFEMITLTNKSLGGD
jgi:hypothetical protein